MLRLGAGVLGQFLKPKFPRHHVTDPHHRVFDVVDVLLPIL